MNRLLWQDFQSWLQSKGQNKSYPQLLSAHEHFFHEFSHADFKNLFLNEEFVEVFKLYEEYRKEDNGPRKVFWCSYLDMVTILLTFIRATREGDWDLHLECIKEMLPWFFAYDHINYARYLPVYLIHMLALPETHPEAHQMLAGGDFGVQRTSHGFSQVPVDQTIEQTINRSTKTKGGIVGFSLRKGAVQKWFVTAHDRAAFVDKCRTMVATSGGGQGGEQWMHKETGSARLKADEADVERVREVVGSWCNPFEESHELTCISSGKAGMEKVQEDLLHAREKGQSAFTSFVQERLIDKSKDYFDPMKKLMLGTFSEAKKKTRVRAAGRDVIIKADRNLFARLLVIAKSRQIDMREVLTHELGPMPWSLASADGSLAKTNKANLCKLLETGVDYLPSLPPTTSVVIIDAMALLQTLGRIPDKFADLALMVLNIVFVLAGDTERIDLVADQYPEISIKNVERSRRRKDGEVVTSIASPQQLCPRQWKKFLANGSNKTNLMNFFVQQWSKDIYKYKLSNRTLFVSHGSDCTKITSAEGAMFSSIVPELCSNQEEADTRMFLHAIHASSDGHSDICIRSSDKDVEVLACNYQEFLSANLVIASGTKTRTRLISIPRICEKIGKDICRVLPGLHALTGCDSVSTFTGKGKKKALDLITNDNELTVAVGALGDHLPLGDDDKEGLEQFVCSLYNDSGRCINEARHSLFCKSQHLQSHQLPPTKDALEHHLKRANFQTYIWRNAFQTNILHQNPDRQGWKVVEDQLEIVWTNLPPAPQAIMELVSCSCSKTCETRRCSCVRSALPCTDACKCNNCVNCPTDDFSTLDSDGLDLSDEEYDSI